MALLLREETRGISGPGALCHIKALLSEAEVLGSSSSMSSVFGQQEERRSLNQESPGDQSSAWQRLTRQKSRMAAGRPQTLQKIWAI